MNVPGSRVIQTCMSSTEGTKEVQRRPSSMRCVYLFSSSTSGCRTADSRRPAPPPQQMNPNRGKTRARSQTTLTRPTNRPRQIRSGCRNSIAVCVCVCVQNQHDLHYLFLIITRSQMFYQFNFFSSKKV